MSLSFCFFICMIALKKRSQERSKAALKNPLIAGVVTSHMDPLLVAERSKRERKKKAALIRSESEQMKLSNSRRVSSASGYSHTSHASSSISDEFRTMDQSTSKTRKSLKPFKMVKTERTLTEFLMGNVSP